MRATIRLDGSGGVVLSDGQHEVRISRRWLRAMLWLVSWSMQRDGLSVEDLDDDWKRADPSDDPLVVTVLAPEATAHDAGEVTWEAT